MKNKTLKTTLTIILAIIMSFLIISISNILTQTQAADGIISLGINVNDNSSYINGTSENYIGFSPSKVECNIELQDQENQYSEYYLIPNYSIGSNDITFDFSEVTFPKAGIYYYTIEFHSVNYLYDEGEYEIISFSPGSMILEVGVDNTGTVVEAQFSNENNKNNKISMLDIYYNYEYTPEIPEIEKKDLTISKSITGNYANPDDIFRFEITFSGIEQNDMQDNYITVDGSNVNTYGFELSNGSHSFSLGGGDSITFHDVPINTYYTITESGPGNYDTKWNGNSGSTTDTLMVADVDYVQFVNDHTMITSDLKITKRITGDASDHNDTFNFQLVFYYDEDIRDFISIDGNITSSSFESDYGCVYNFTLGDEDSITFENVPANIDYYICENISNLDTWDYITTWEDSNENCIYSDIGLSSSVDIYNDIVCVNDKTLTLNTGIQTKVFPFIGLIGVAIIGFLFVFINKKHKLHK
jgi:hypothetical protein